MIRKAVLISSLLTLLLFPTEVFAQSVSFVSADLSTSLGAFEHRGTGLHGSARLSIPENMLAPIKPSLTRRAIDESWQRAQQLLTDYGETFTIEQIFSQNTSFDSSLAVGNYGPWEANVHSLIDDVKRNSSLYPNINYRYDIWNEPGGFDKVPEANFIEAWIRAAKIVRQRDPGKLIVGPSYADFFAGTRRTSFSTFLDKTKAAGVPPDIFNYHEAIGVVNPKDLQDRLDAAKAMLASKGLSSTPIEWNEMISDNNKTDPGAAVIHFSVIERNRLVAGAKAYWGDAEGYPNSSNYFMDHLLTKNYQPRSIWWAYRRYAEMSGTVVQTSYSSNADAVVTKDAGKKKVFIVIGKYGSSGDVSVKLQNVSSTGFLGSTVSLRGERIANTGITAVGSLAVTMNTTATVTNNSLTITIPASQMAQWDAYSIEVTPVGGTPLPTPTPSSCIGDLDNDHDVDLSDYAAFTRDFLKNPPSNPKSDLTGDGKVNLSDYTEFVRRFLRPCA